MIAGKTRVWITAVVMLGSVFLAGLLAGAAVTEMEGPELVRERMGARGADRRGPDSRGDGRAGRNGGPPGMPGGGRVPLLPPSFVERLELSDAQRASLDQLLQRRRSESDAILREMYPRLRAQVDSTHAEIRELLTPEQQAIFDERRESRLEVPGRSQPPRR
jgi:Spy/CpxP family protein refolding chaperone